MSQIANGLTPPYYAVIFSNNLVSNPSPQGYSEMADRMCELAAQQPGYLGFETSRDENGMAISVSYWKDNEAIGNWKQVSEHLSAQELGKSRWYAEYRVRICKVEREYGWQRS